MSEKEEHVSELQEHAANLQEHVPASDVEAYEPPPVRAVHALRRHARGYGSMPERVIVMALVFGLAGGGIGSYLFIRFFASYVPVAKRQLVVEESSAVINVASKVSPAVVSITSQGVTQGFMGTTEQVEGAGTGMIINSDGLILTNRHVVDDTSATYTVVTSNGKSYPATVVARDSENDIAFVKISASGLPTVSLGDSAAVQVGQQVIAIGNALGQFQNTVTDGIISGLSRGVTAGDDSGDSTSSETLSNMFQTDAAINPGNSGGPLVNLYGQVIGMDTAVAGQGSQNIGFAIPINDIKTLIPGVESTGKITRPYLGVEYIPIDPSVAAANNLPVTSGAWIESSDGTSPGVVAGSPADNAGIKTGDIITKVGSDTIDASHSLQSIIAQYKPGDKVTVTINRNGTTMTLSVTLGTAPSD